MWRWTTSGALLAAAVTAACGGKGRPGPDAPEEAGPSPSPLSVVESMPGVRDDAPGTPADAEGTTGVAMTFEKTTALVGDPELRRLVDDLAAARRIESAVIGAAAARSDVWAKYEALVARATPADVAALLRHRSPVVRGYMGQHVVRRQPADLATAYALLADTTAVETVSGCTIAWETVAEVVAGELCNRVGTDPPAALLLLRAAGDRALGRLRGRALECVAGRHKTEAGRIALALLDEGDRALLRDAVTVLGMTGVNEAAGRIAALGEDADPTIRAAAATALARLQAPQAAEVLLRLVRDADDYVRAMAGRGYARLPDPDPAVIRSLFDDPKARVGDQTAEGLAEAGTPAALALLAERLRTHGASGNLFRTLEANPRPEVTTMMRALLDSTDWYVRKMAIVHLGRAGDTTSAPRIRMALDAETIHERQAAAEALGRLGDAAAVDDLVRLLQRDTNPHGRIAAAQALVALRALDRLPALEGAAAAETTWAAEELRRQAAALRALAAGP